MADERMSKAEAEYTSEGTPAEHCGNCSMYVPPIRCTAVRGDVEHGGWCRLWEREHG